MRRVKFITTSLALLLTIILFHSCLDKNESEYPWLAISTIRTLDETNKEYYFNLDNGSKLYPGDTTALRNYEVIAGQRAFVYYKTLEERITGYDENIKVGLIVNILTKDIVDLTSENAQEIGDDKINVTRAWVAQGYLNFEFQYLGTHSSSKKHYLNLVRNTTTNENNEEEYIALEFRHNAEDDAPERIGEGYVSFKLDLIEAELERAEGLKIRVNTIYDGEKFIQIKLDKPAKDANTKYPYTANKILNNIY